MPRNESYFIAITLPEPLHSEIESLKKYISKKYETRSVLKSPAHITIIPPFFWGNESDLLDFVTGWSFKPFEIQLNNFKKFEQRVVFIDVVTNPDLMNLHQQFNHDFFKRYSGINKRHPYVFHPHITIGNRDWKPANFESCWNEFQTKKFSGKFSCSGLMLLKNVGNLWMPLCRG